MCDRELHVCVWKEAGGSCASMDLQKRLLREEGIMRVVSDEATRCDVVGHALLR